ncbi:hypothetical protein [Tenacibaculum maritimum]|uniref:hypothetical protein n=1 Tax=Tenacibaculum maritimum TaxID=107401 RepID=UPI0012E67ED4|nr:hypothetical protein [Tenacibaculum maritimum]CAA0214058.1 hypothetical protein FS0810_290021 [Tenacibaculum maritimum]
MKLLTIHPINEDLRFLRKFVRNLKSYKTDLVISRTLSNNTVSHTKAIQFIERLDENDLVCFLSHGATRAIHGSEYRAKYGSHSRQYSYMKDNGYFIDKNNIEILRGKKVFCLSCNSDTLGKLAIESGVKVFIGFSTIDFDNRDELIPNQNPRSYVIAKTKYSLRKAVYQSIIFAIENNVSFYQLNQLLKINLNKEMDNLILNNKNKEGYLYYKTAADCLLTIKEGITLFGNGDIKLLD